MKKKPLIYICSPFRGDTEKNTANAIVYSAQAFALGYIPITPHIYFTRFMDDNDKRQRAAAMKCGEQLLLMCSELWAFGLDKPSEGMQKEIALAIRSGIPVRDGEQIVGKLVRRIAAKNSQIEAARQTIIDAALPPLDAIYGAIAPAIKALTEAAGQ